MSDNDLTWRRLDAIVAELQLLDAETNGQFRQASDKEAFDIVCRIERRARSAQSARNDLGFVSRGRTLPTMRADHKVNQQPSQGDCEQLPSNTTDEK